MSCIDGKCTLGLRLLFASERNALVKCTSHQHESCVVCARTRGEHIHLLVASLCGVAFVPDFAHSTHAHVVGVLQSLLGALRRTGHQTQSILPSTAESGLTLDSVPIS